MNEDVKLAKWLNDELSGAELQEFMSLPEYQTYLKIREYSAELTAPEANLDTLYSTIQHKRNEKGRVRKLTPWLSRVAAVLIMALSITYFFYTTHTTTELAQAGKRTEFILPDNSEVVLNAGSEAEYRSWNWQGHRKVELNGEAFFKVAKGETFDVVTPVGKVTVVGTQFNVKARGNRLDVTCFEGKVKVTSGNEAVFLTPGESVAYNNGKMVDGKIITSITGTAPGWMTKEAYFYKENVEGIAKELERQYNVKISVPLIPETEVYTGTLPMDDLDTALDIIATAYSAYDMKVEKAGSKITLTAE
jgi:transmembrane sensor